MALSEPFSIGPEQGEVHRNVGLLIASCLPGIVFEQAAVGASPRRLSLHLSAGAAAAHHAAGAHGPRAGVARVAGGGFHSMPSADRTAPGRRRCSAAA
jgi:hypothetical protein